MVHRQKLISLAAALLLAIAVSATGQKFDPSSVTIRNSNEASDTTYGEHGGRVIRRAHFMLESVVDPDGIRIYVYDAPNRMLDPGEAGGTVRISSDTMGFTQIELTRVRDPKKRTPRFRSTKYKRGYYLYAPFDFSLNGDGDMTWRVAISGLPGQPIDVIRYSMPFGMTPLRGWACRGHEHRVFLKYKDHPLCDSRYLDPAPFLYQCPLHAHSRADRKSACPLCSAERVPTRQSLHPFSNSGKTRARQGNTDNRP